MTSHRGLIDSVADDDVHQMQRELLQGVASSALKPATAARLLRALARAEMADAPIAIVGMAGRWPGAADVDALWRLSADASVQVRPFPASRRRRMAPWVDATATLAPGSYLDEIDGFDPARFGLSARETELMDPSHRAFLDIAWRAFEDAGLQPLALAGHSVGVFAGYCNGSDDTSYEDLIHRHRPELASLALTGTLPPLLSGRISHLLNLRGPSLVIDTACSSSLVAVHYACQALRHGDCELALAGGVKLILWPRAAAQDAIGIESADGMTRTFAGGSPGAGIGEGVAAIVLKPLAAALRDGDRVHAVIAGSACNHDGYTTGLTVPSVDAQREVIERAWRTAGVSASNIDCIEAHGTGTRLGDPIEFEALARALSGATQRCAVGSIKSLFGHLDSAAGITGLIRAALMVRHGELLPSLNFGTPNEGIDFLGSALYVNDRLRPWPHDKTRHAGVSAFSMNGTNCHVVLRQAPVAAPAAAAREQRPLANRARYWFAEAPAQRPSPPASPPIASRDGADIDAAIAIVWRDVLGRDIAPEDDFFAVGGDSLKAVVVASRLSQALGRAIGAGQLWRTPSMAGLRKWLQAQAATAVEVVPRAGPRHCYPVAPAQVPVFLHAALHRDVLYNVPFAMRLEGPLDAARLEAVVSAVCAADAGLAVRFFQSAGRVMQRASERPACSFEYLAADANDAVTPAIAAAASRFIQPFDVETGPLARFALLRLAPEQNVLLMDFHHLVMDGVSVSILWRRIERAWRGEVAASPALHALDYAVWRERRANEGRYGAHAQFWRRRLKSLPDGRVRAIRASKRIDALRHTLTLSFEASAAIHRFAAECGVGLFATLITAYAIGVRQLWGQPAFNIGTPLAGRVQAGTENVLGMFVNLYPIGMRLHDEEPVLALTRAAGSQLADMFEYQDAPLDARKAGDPQAQFNVVFALQNMSLGAAELGSGVCARPIPFYELPWQVAKFDLSLFAMTVDERLVLSFEARRDAIEATDIERLAATVRALLTVITADRQLCVGGCLGIVDTTADTALTFDF